MSKSFLDNTGLGIYDEEIKKYIKKHVSDSISSTVVQEESYLNFPTVGKETTIYIDITTNKIYRWSDKDIKYYVVFDHYDDIQIINTNF